MNELFWNARYKDTTMRVLLRGCKGLRRSYLVAPILLLLLVGAALTALLPSIEDRGNVGAMGALRRRATAGSNANAIPRHQMEEQAEQDATAFTIVIQTYNRTDVLLKLLNHYQAVPHLRRVIIVWNNIGERTPQELWDALGPHPIPVVFKEQRVNRMRNRLQPFAEIDTDAVLMLDDDTLVSVPDISFAFSVWKQFPDQIVGFVPRKHVTTVTGVYSYGSFELQDPEMGGGDRYSMVLIGAAFFHRRYLQLFQEQPPEVHALVDDTQNCDDIAMNFAVAAELQRGSEAIKSRPSGIFVKPVDMRNLERDASSGYLGMWHRPEHLLQRSYCLNRLAQIYGAMPLRYSNMMLCQFGFPSYANHKSRG
ncbi:exostosin-like 2 [Coregonus clupeaformis]|uniref:exostosin-like 2 n=1 Tax=Coregonus clupeaformis TaxID=59861 RepID=UPI001BE013A5|nr:exostosin-like 2 [Coregonus clupeaformis]